MGDLFTDTGAAQCAPYGGLIAGDNRQAEVGFNGFDDIQYIEAGAAYEDTVCSG